MQEFTCIIFVFTRARANMRQMCALSQLRHVFWLRTFKCIIVKLNTGSLLDESTMTTTWVRKSSHFFCTKVTFFTVSMQFDFLEILQIFLKIRHFIAINSFFEPFWATLVEFLVDQNETSDSNFDVVVDLEDLFVNHPDRLVPVLGHVSCQSFAYNIYRYFSKILQYAL